MSRSLYAPTQNLESSIARLERQDLVGQSLPLPSLEGELVGSSLVRLVGIGRFWGPGAGGQTLRNATTGLLTGLAGQGVPLMNLLLGSEDGVTVVWGCPGPRAGHREFLPRLLQGSFPGVEIEHLEPSSFPKTLGTFPHVAALTGNPAPKEDEEDQMERLLRGMAGERWAFLVLAAPIPTDAVGESFQLLAEESRRVKNTYLREGTIERENHPLARHYVDLLEAALGKVKGGRLQGMWEVRAYLFAASPAVLARGVALLMAAVAGDRSLPTPVRLHPCALTVEKLLLPPSTPLNSQDLAILVGPPGQEVQGYAVRPFARFTVALPETKKAHSLAIGQLLEGSRPTGSWFDVERDDLTKHALIAGVPGSGKTTSAMGVLEQLWREHRIPWIVIEPAVKTEYRELRATPWGRELRVFTLGDEREAPFRLNPLELEPGVPVLTHIDFLRALFQAAFAGLYPPMPYLLEQALYRIYEAKGWNLAAGINARGEGPRIYPTLSELAVAVEEVVDQAGYAQEITQNIRTALRVRLESLRTGAKGCMLDIRHGIPMGELLEWPTVLELSQIGDDEEKAFLIGLFLIRLFERRSLDARRGPARGLRHVTLVEEAHRLLRHVQPTGSLDASQAQAKGVEAFCHLLAEMRALGEGVIVCEQIPTKLAPDVVKNTNLKLLHRLVAEEDRRVVGASMVMDETQQRMVATLATGEAIVYAEGLHGPCRLRVPNYREHAVDPARLTAQDLRAHMESGFFRHHPEILRPSPACQGCPGNSSCPALSLDIQRLQGEAEFREVSTSCFLALVEGQGVADSVIRLIEGCRRALDLPSLQDAVGPAICAFLREADHALEARASAYRLTVGEIDEILTALTSSVRALGKSIDQHGEVRLNPAIAGLLHQFQRRYHAVCQRSRGPAIGCRGCQVPCRYRFEVSQVVGNDGLRAAFEAAIHEAEPEEVWERLAEVVQDAADDLLLKARPNTRRDLAYCITTLLVANDHYPVATQERLTRNLREVLDRQVKEKEENPHG